LRNPSVGIVQFTLRLSSFHFIPFRGSLAYDLTLELYSETTEVAYLCGDFEQVESWAAIVLQEAKTVLDSMKVYEVKIQTDIAQNQPLRAINTALQVLKQLGINFPEEPSQTDIQLELDTITSRLGASHFGKNIR